MIEQIKKDLRAQVEVIQHRGYPMDKAIWGEEGVLLSGAEALALLEYIESLEFRANNLGIIGKRPDDKEPLTEEKLTGLIDNLEPGYINNPGTRLTFDL